jgi:disulfide oxidoreductase YuzD
VNITVNGDTTFESNETFNVNLTTPTNATISDNQGLGTITNDDTQPTISITDVTHNEGQAGTTDYDFIVTLSNSSSQTITVNAATADSTGTTADSDYAGVASTPLTFSPSTTTQHFHVLVNGDSKFEPNEAFLVNLTTPTNATISDNQGLGTITNDDTQPTISITDVTHNEGQAGTTDYDFIVTLSNSSSQTITVNAATADSTGTTADSDYAGVASTPLTFSPSTTTQHFHVLVNGDSKFEPNEAFLVNLTGATNATVSDAQGLGTITNDDTQPTISINDVTVTEGNSGTSTATFTVSLTNASSQTITVNYLTGGNTADAGIDFETANGTATITPGQLSTTINVTINGDTTFEPNERFVVGLVSPTNATTSDDLGEAIINNDDSQPTISINNAGVTEGNAGLSVANFTVSLSNPSYQTITVNYATADATAAASSDYMAASGTVTFASGAISQALTVNVNGDTTFESNETFDVNLSAATNATITDNQGVGTINNDDAQPTISINDVTVTEGNTGTVAATFTVTLSNASSQTITMNYATADGTAAANGDYASASGTVTFTPNQLTQSVSITVNGDTALESNETFTVNLSGATNATIADNQGAGTINNDDGQPTISINDVSVNEGSGATSAGFTVSLSNASDQTITVNYATANNTAIAGVDYVASNGTVTFTPGQTSQPVNVIVNGDLLSDEASLTFNVNLTAPTNATIADNQGVGTITDDDAPELAHEANSQRAIALDAVTFVRDPFAVTNTHYFGADQRTRVSLFATNLNLTPGLVVTAQAVDAQQLSHPLTVESVGTLPAFLGFTQVVVKLPDGIVNAGDLQVTITVHGKTSNSVLIGVTP